MQVTFRIKRLDPERNPVPKWEDFVVEDVTLTDTVLDEGKRGRC